MNSFAKRKEPGDLVDDLLNVSLSPAKKLRVEDSGATASFRGPAFGAIHSLEGPLGSARAILEQPTRASPQQPAAPHDEKALVLYRPLTTPLFPGGPPAGSVDFPYKLNTALLPIPQGTDRELTSHQLDCQSACSSDPDATYGHGLFQALDLSGGPGPLFGQRRLQRVSSCSSLPRFASDNEDQLMEVEGEKPADLAVIPWVPATPLVLPPKLRSNVEEPEEEPDTASEVDPMVYEDSMEVVTEDNASGQTTGATATANHLGNTVSNFNTTPWQTEILQPPYTTAMWSH